MNFELFSPDVTLFHSLKNGSLALIKQILFFHICKTNSNAKKTEKSFKSLRTGFLKRYLHTHTKLIKCRKCLKFENELGQSFEIFGSISIPDVKGFVGNQNTEGCAWARFK